MERTRTIAAAVVGLAALAAAAACGDSGSPTRIEGSGVAMTSTRSLPSFTRVELAGVGTVRVHAGPPQAVTVSGDDNVVPLVTTEVEGDTLVVAERRGNFTTRQPLVVDVRAPVVDGSTLSGAGELLVDGVEGPAFDASLDGTGRLDVDGATDRLDAAVAGTGAAQLEHLVAKDAQIVVSGVGSAQVYATHSLDASVEGAGSIRYGGEPAQVTQHVSGVGVVQAD